MADGLFSLILRPPWPVRLSSRLGLSDCRQKLVESFAYPLGRLGLNKPSISLIKRQWSAQRTLAGRIDGDQITATILGRRITSFGPVGHTSAPVLKATLSSTAHGTLLVGQVGDRDYTRRFAKLWFGLLLFFFFPVTFLVVVANPAERQAGLLVVGAVVGMLAFGVILMRMLTALRDADGRDLVDLLAAAIDAEVQVPQRRDDGM